MSLSYAVRITLMKFFFLNWILIEIEPRGDKRLKYLFIKKDIGQAKHLFSYETTFIVIPELGARIVSFPRRKLATFV